MMAGVVATPQERALQRYERRMMRAQRIGQQELVLLELIARRERGEDGAKPMPFAKQDGEQE
jgi:hypothetical protein